MRIRCHAEHDGKGVVLNQIRCAEDAISLCCFFAEKGAPATMIDAHEQDGFRMILHGISIAEFDKLVAGSNIELID